MTQRSRTPRTRTGVDVAVLAAGHGTRLKSAVPKHLHPVCGVPIVERVIRAGLAIDPDRLVAVVGPSLADLPDRLRLHGQFETVIQEVPEGTAAAVRCALDALGEADWLVSLLGDSPLLTGETVQALLDGARSSGARVTLLTCHVDDASSYGRIERDERGRVTSIVELKNDLPARRTGRVEVNSGIMVLDAAWARPALAGLARDRQTAEYMLTDLVEIAVRETPAGEGWPVAAVIGPAGIALGVNDRAQLAEADAIARGQVRDRLMRSGVSIIGPETVFIDETVSVGKDTTILPYSMLIGKTTIGEHARIGPHAILHDAAIGNRVAVQSSTIRDSRVEDDVQVGPYAHLRDGTHVGPGVHIGTSTEVKNSRLGAGVQAGHFSYLGDATIGDRANIGAGVVTANFDGVSKHRTEIGAGAFIGSDSVLVAPIVVGERSVTGAGAVVTHDVPAGETVVGVPARAFVRGGSGTARE